MKTLNNYITESNYDSSNLEELKKKLLKMSKSFYEPKYLKIDYYINLTLEDYKSGKDVMLEKCCNWIKSIDRE